MSTMPKPALRPYLPSDAPLLAEIFQASIEELTGDDYSRAPHAPPRAEIVQASIEERTGDDYSEAQQAAWASLADDEEAFGAHLAQNLTLVATADGDPVGFASLKGNEQIEMLYVHPGA